MNANTSFMQIFSYYRINNDFARIVAAALMLLVTPVCFAAKTSVTDLGQAYTPPGANFSISALQGIDANGGGGTTNGASVIQNFETVSTYGVSYTDSKNKVQDFALGIYGTAGKGPHQAGSIFSTGLEVDYFQPVLASSTSFVLTDFDLKSGASGFLSNKVEPSLLLLNTDGSIFASATPAQIFPNLTAVADPLGGNGGDWYNLNTAGLLSTLGQADGAIGGVILYADQSNGEKVGSDPYQLYSVGNGTTVVPEPGSGFLVVVIGCGVLLRSRKRSLLSIS